MTPVIVTDVPTDPEFGFKLWMPGPDPTANTRPLLDSPATVTITGPVVAPVGTGTAILAGLQLVAVAKVPLKVTVLVPCAEPKFEPEIVTEVPVDPPLGDKFESTGTGTLRTLNGTPLLATPPTVITILPELDPVGTAATMLVALQLVGVAMTPLKVTVLLPCEDPKLKPEMVTDVPMRPESGETAVICGTEVDVTRKSTALDVRVPTVTITSPLVAPSGTGTMMLVELQLVGVENVPLKVTSPCVTPKLLPVIVTEVPTGPDAGDRLETTGAIEAGW